jgi:hypothetical protein
MSDVFNEAIDRQSQPNDSARVVAARIPTPASHSAQSAATDAGSIVGEIMAPAPRIIRGKPDKLPPHYYLFPRSAEQPIKRRRSRAASTQARQ